MEVRDGRGNPTGVDRSVLWANLAGFHSAEEFAPSWLALLVSFITHAVQGVLVYRDGPGGSFAPLAQWPPDGVHDPQRLADVCERSMGERIGLLTELPPLAGVVPAQSHRWGIAYPLIIDDELSGTVALEIEAAREEELRAAMEQLQWGMLTLELIFRRIRAREEAVVLARLRSSVDILASVLAEEDYTETCMTFVAGVAELLGCDRVSLGLVRDESIRIQAISHSANFDKRMNFIHALSMAMDEAVLQSREIIYPQPTEDGPLITRNHEDLSKRFGAQSLLTVPLYGRERYFGALTLERSENKMFSTEEVSVCKSVFALVAPILEGRKVQDYSLARHGWEAIKRTAGKLFGPGHLEWKAAAAAVCAVVIFFTFAQGEQKVTARTTLEGMVKRTVAAPFRGYIKEALVRPGDTVTEGQTLCKLDERDLRFERTDLQGQESQMLRQQQQAVADHDWAKANVAKAQLDQVIAQLDLNGVKLDRTTIKAPFDGILVNGDLSQRIGSAVDQGDALFEISPLSSYRLILMVDESDIAYVHPGQRGELVLSSLPGKFNFVVGKITPVTAALEGVNAFRVEAALEGAPGVFRPGMEGISKINIQRGKLLSIWTLKMRQWFRLKMWAWLP
ncbi:MAG: HlyD family efflux transporter periplasmic adaptor subunit [Terracidiphilus sp.]